jgi:hypothetical protein
MVLGSRTRSTYTALKKSSVYECVYRIYVFNPRKCLNANPILLSQNNGVLVPVPILQVAFHTLSSSSTALALYTAHSRKVRQYPLTTGSRDWRTNTRWPEAKTMSVQLSGGCLIGYAGVIIILLTLADENTNLLTSKLREPSTHYTQICPNYR